MSAGDDIKVRGYDAVGNTWPYLALSGGGGVFASPERTHVQRDYSAAGPLPVATAKTWFQCVVTNLSATVTAYFMVFDSVAPPVLGAAPLAILEVLPGETVGIGGPAVSIVNTLYWASSTTRGLLTIIGAPLLDVQTWWGAAP